MLFLVLLLSLCLAKRENDHILEIPEYLTLSNDRDLIIGAVFSTYSGIQTAKLPLSAKHQPLICIRIYGNCGSGFLSINTDMAMMNERNISHTENNCSTYEDLIPCKNCNDDTTELRYENNIYNAGFTVELAYSLHSLLRCCEKDKTTQSCQIDEFLEKLDCTTAIEEVWIDSTGVMTAKYNEANWQEEEQEEEEEKVQHKAVVYYVASWPSGQRFVLNPEDTVWTEVKIEKPRSVCSESCPPGTRKAAQKGRPVCCYDCIPCAEGEISNQTDSDKTEQCPGEWSNADRDKCVLKVIELMGIGLILCYVFESALSVSVTILFIVEKDSHTVKSNNSELSFLLLFSLTLTSNGRLSQWSCMLGHTAFGIMFVLCVSVSVLGKTIVVLMAFRATLPGSNRNNSKKHVT